LANKKTVSRSRGYLNHRLILGKNPGSMCLNTVPTKVRILQGPAGGRGELLWVINRLIISSHISGEKEDNASL